MRCVALASSGGKLSSCFLYIGQKPPLKLKEIWAIRTRLHLSGRLRDLALLNLAVDSKLRVCDLVKLRVSDISHGSQMARRAVVLHQKTGRPIQFEITDQARNAASAWIEQAGLRFNDFLFLSRSRQGDPIPTRHRRYHDSARPP